MLKRPLARALGSRTTSGVGLLALAAIAAAAMPSAASATDRAPAYSQGHPYRHGVVPTRGRQHDAAFGPAYTSTANDLKFGGGVSGVGVTTGAPKVYLVFWGSQWGTQSTNGSGYATFSGDPDGVAPDLQAFFKGLGTSGETWSGVMTQYCQGVATGTVSCPSSNTQHVGYPTGGALAGVWEDTSVPAPSQATAHQIAAEAVNAASHFGNTSQTANRNTQYVIISPTGANPDGYQSAGFCAWHDYTGDPTMDGGGAVSSPDGLLAFTNLPYIPDAGASCGQGFVNGSAGTLDGVTIVEGHEYAETITDQYPAGGWLDASGEETGDKCAWISSGAGASRDITLSTGTFAVQSTWANDANGGSGGCEVSHAIVTNGGAANTVTVTNPGNQSGTVGASTSLQVHASDSASGQTLSYSATGLPPGLSIGSSTGLISGTPTAANTYSVTVTATDGTGASGNATFSWTVTPPSGGTGCTAQQLLGNPGFETGTAAPWTATAGVIEPASAGEPAHSGNYVAWLDGYNAAHTDTLAQQVSIPSGCTTYTLGFWLHIDTADTSRVATSKLQVQVLNSSGTVLGTLATFSQLNRASGYQQHSYSLAQYKGQTVTLKFTGTQPTSRPTSFVIDDTSLNVS